MNKTSPTHNQDYSMFLRDVTKILLTFIKESELLRVYINDSLIKTGTNMMCAVPQINKEWDWQSIRKVENILEEQRIAALL